MKDNEIIEGNRMIALFDGWREYQFNSMTGENYPVLDGEDSSVNWRVKIIRSTDADSLEYHTNWQWIMPVVEKIERLGYPTLIITNFLRKKLNYEMNIYNKTNELLIEADFGYETKIESVWQAVEAFVKWHNSQQKSESKEG